MICFTIAGYSVVVGILLYLVVLVACGYHGRERLTLAELPMPSLILRLWFGSLGAGPRKVCCARLAMLGLGVESAALVLGHGS